MTHFADPPLPPAWWASLASSGRRLTLPVISWPAVLTVSRRPTERAAAPVLRLAPRDGGASGADHGSIVDDLYRKHARYLAGVVFRMLGNSDDVDDVLQEVFCVAMQKVDELTRVDELRSWLATVATRSAGKRLRRRKLLRALGLQDDLDYDSVASPNAPFDDRVELKRLYRALDRLPVRQRLAWTTRYLENEPMEEVARRCGGSLSTAKRDVSTAHASLTKELGYG